MTQGASLTRQHGAVVAVRLCLALLVMVAGLSLRGFGHELGLPSLIVKYGGSILWATMVFFIVAAVLAGVRLIPLGGVALAVSVAVEMSRLIHTPWLDAFRLSAAGALLLGRVFSLWDLVAYAAGVALGMMLDRLICAGAQVAPDLR